MNAVPPPRGFLSRTRPRGTLLPAVAVALLLLAGAPANGADDDIEFSSPPGSGELDDLTAELGVAIAAPGLAPAEPLGTARFELHVSATATRIDSGARFWRNAVRDGDPPSTVVIPRASLRVGLPASLDLGAHYAAAPSSNVRVVGGDLKWAFLKGGTVKPALAARLAHSRLNGVDELDLDATSLELLVSKGFGPVTPYAGAGAVRVSSEVHDLSVGPSGFRRRSSRTFGQALVGARVTAGFFRLAIEARRAESLTSASLRLGFWF